jgi:uncharacterized SAM-binding protein YcdF (DUF218 family)
VTPSFGSRAAGAVLRAVLVLIAVTLPIGFGFVRFIDHLPPPTDDQSRTDAIVVLTGGGERVSAGLALLEAGKAQRLFVSGVHPGVGVGELLRIDRGASGPKPSDSAPSDSALAARIDLGDTAGDTYGNSVESVAWMRLNRFTTMRLVTADYHMPRALIEFRMEAPDIAIVPNPVQPLKLAGTWWRDRAVFNLLLGEYGKYLVAKWRYLFVQLLDKA